MQNASKMGRIVAILVVVVGLGILIGWWASRDSAPPVVNTTPPPPAPVVAPKNQITEEQKQQAMEKAAQMEEQHPQEPAPGWEEKLDKILLDDTTDEAKKAAGILALMKESPEDAQVELSQHLINMVMDDNYTDTAQLLTNSATPAAVSTVLMNDLLNRNNNLKLPLLLDLASNDQHPLKGEAKEMLELFVQEDHGTNWADWKTAIDNWLKENQ